MVVELIAVGCFLMAAVAELVHRRRCRRVWILAFAGGKPALWVHTAPWLRALACGALAWGLLVLLTSDLDSTAEEQQELAVAEPDIGKSRHVVVILDVSPSMLITDSGATGVQRRAQRAVDVMDSILERVAREDVRYSLVAVYTDARPVIVASSDAGVLKNIMELPLEQAFDHGKTHLLKGVETAFEIAGDWAPESTLFVMLTDGDTVDVGKAGFPRAPKSMAGFLVAGLGTRRGAFIDGHQSRQDSGTLHFLASRFDGFYHDVNVRHIPTQAMGFLAAADDDDSALQWTRRQVALAACGAGASLLALLPILLEAFGFNLAKHLATRQQLPTRVQA